MEKLPEVGECREEKYHEDLDKAALIGDKVGVVVELIKSELNGEEIVRLSLTGGAEKPERSLFLGAFGASYLDVIHEEGELRDYHDRFRKK